MSVGFGDDFKEQVRAATSIYDLVSETVNLTQNGRDYKGLCPFHDDKNPSFNVYPDRQTYRCWVCDKGGDCFTWVQEVQVTTFPEALEILAERANIEVPKRSQSEFAKKSQDSKVTQYEIVDWAISLMQQALRMGEAGELARRYASERNLSEETQRKFRLGYHPENWNWLLDKAKGHFTEKQLLSVGLVGERDNGRGYYDNLVGRFVFPIIDERGRPVAFGGRVLPGSNIESPAKYWNSPESNIFLKRKTLYAFEQARNAIRTGKSAIIVEGYMDCIACHQAGVTNAVATLGTALTEDHVKFLKRFAERVVLIYDGDQAGKDAAERSIGRFLAQDLDLRVLTLEEGQDPADFLENNGKDEFETLIGTAPEAWEYKLQTVTDRYGIDSVSGRQQVMNQLMEFLAAAPGLAGTLREDLILRKVCQRVQADETTVRRQLQELRSNKATRRFIRQDQPVQAEPVNLNFNGVDLAERELLEVILSCPDYTDYIRHQIGSDDFNNTQHRQLLELCFDLVTEEGILPDAQSVIAAAESDSATLSLVNALLDTANEKGISELMREQPLTDETGGTTVPPHLERVLHPILQRRAKNQNMLSKQKLAQADSSSSKLNNDTMDALRRIFRFRQSQMGDDPPSLK
ncbi:MAG: DNA primase [Fuerstiella sp.]|nr:DNA primase [Fuerstiella sp.]MDG2127815.1 DNA primase [Fuerstiella sp.]